MKPEKELFWLAQLYKSRYTDDGWNLKFGMSGCKNDIIKELNVSDKNKDAFNFISLLIREGIIKGDGIEDRETHKKIQLYRIKGKLLIDYAKKNPEFNTLKHFFNYDRVI